MPKYAELLYNGFWYSPERLALQAAIDKTQEFVTGTVRLKLYKVCLVTRQPSKHTLVYYDECISNGTAIGFLGVQGVELASACKNRATSS